MLFVSLIIPQPLIYDICSGLSSIHRSISFNLTPYHVAKLCFAQLLELSGFGDRAVLEKVGIDVKVDLPGVGANVQEHLFSGVTYGAMSEQFRRVPKY